MTFLTTLREMAHIQKQEQALGLFVRGYSTNEVAAELAVNIRTVQRWHKQWKIQQGLIPDPTNVKSEADPSPTAIVKAEQPEVVKQVQSAVEPKLLGFPGDYEKWDAAITKKFKELEEFHRNERLIYISERDKKMAKGELTSRDANNYSQIMGRHAEQEWRMPLMGKSDLPTMTQAYAWMRKTGHVVKKAGGENDDISGSSVTAEDIDANQEGHGIS